MLEGSPEAKVTPVGCAVGPPITGQLNLEGIPVLGLVDTGTSVTCIGFSVWWQYRTQWGPLKPFEGGSPRRAWKTAPDYRKNPAPESTMGRSKKKGELHSDHRSRVASSADRNGHYAASTGPY